MADIKQKYPSADTTALTITLASLATSSTLLVGRESTVVNNTSNLDLDHIISGKFTTGTSPTAATRIEVWAYAPISITSGTPAYIDTVTGSDAGITITSDNVKFSGLRPVWSTTVDSTSNRTYYMPPTSIANVFGEMPAYWGIIVTHSTAVNLNSTSSNHAVHYHRIQKQTV